MGTPNTSVLRAVDYAREFETKHSRYGVRVVVDQETQMAELRNGRTEKKKTTTLRVTLRGDSTLPNLLFHYDPQDGYTIRRIGGLDKTRFRASQIGADAHYSTAQYQSMQRGFEYALDDLFRVWTLSGALISRPDASRGLDPTMLARGARLR